MVALPLALTATYQRPDEPGDYAHVVVYLNGQALLRIVSDDPVADTHSRVEQAIDDAIRRTVARLFRSDTDVEVHA